MFSKEANGFFKWYFSDSLKKKTYSFSYYVKKLYETPESFIQKSRSIIEYNLN